MEMKNQRGLIQLITCLLIFAVFAFTLYACLDILDLIDVPEEYSVSKWLSEHSNQVIIEEYEDTDGSQNDTKSIRVEIQTKKEDEEASSNLVSPIVEGYASQQVAETQTNAYFSYYDQLDEYGKIIYKELEKNMENMKSGTYNVQFGTTFDDLLHEENGEEVLNNAFQLAINSLNFDHPELFYIDISKVYLLTKISTKLWITTYEVEIGASQGQSYLNSSFASQEDVERAINQVNEEKAKIRSTLQGNTENQIKGVHDYLIENLEYDSSVSKDNIYNIYGALVNKYTVCEGYARSFKAMMDDLGIPCLIACGTAINSNDQVESHAWNYVMLDGRWYAIDVTWDDPIIVGNGYVSRDINYKYYLKGSSEFFANHTENGDIVGNSDFKYPILSENNY